jgi:hypothetical protein
VALKERFFFKKKRGMYFNVFFFNAVNERDLMHKTIQLEGKLVAALSSCTT